MTQVETTIRAIQYAEAVYRHMLQRGDRLAMGEGEKNLVYIEGLNPDFTRNDDIADRWNDLRCILEFLTSGQPYFSYVARCTCEPGLSATHTRKAGILGGVARLQLKQYRDACRMGYHQAARRGTAHPALVQVGVIEVHRDFNRDSKRTGDPIRKAYGVNHHSTAPGFDRETVGMWSEGCCVGWNWEQGLGFIEQLKTDPRYQADNRFAWDFALLDAGKLKIDFATDINVAHK